MSDNSWKWQWIGIFAICILGMACIVLSQEVEKTDRVDLTMVDASVLDEQVIVVPESFGKVVSGAGSDHGRYIITFENGFVTGYFQGQYRIVWEES